LVAQNELITITRIRGKMIRLSLLFAGLILCGFGQMPASTTDWRGLSPISSNRMDVERTLGPPNENQDNELLTYHLQDMVVSFYFTSNPKCQQHVPYTSWNVTSDTVTAIDVRLRPAPLVTDTDIESYLRKLGMRG
jgi:hypothetical protein